MSAHLAAPRHAHSELHKELRPAVSTDRGRTRFPFDLPMPGMARIRLSAGRGTDP
jgi:hypothetical protein